MMKDANLYTQWVKSVIPSMEEVMRVKSGEQPYGQPSERVGFIKDTDNFEKLLRGNDIPSPASDTIIKTAGALDAKLPKGYEHLQEAIDLIVNDQIETNPLFKHARMAFTFRQTILPSRPQRTVHIDPPRTPNAAADDNVYFLSNKQGTFTQAVCVKNPSDTLNRMKADLMAEQGLLQQAEPFELRKGTQDTYHVQGADTYESGRTFMRMIITHPDVSYFENLPDDDKAELPADFRQKHGIVVPEETLTIA
tara:strand:- start:28337 stop:29089 length:753 start_codon:yes stop_codon:yes gene_type:complete